ncbi:anthranilate phosphoribosyltransferase [Prochlorococcus marinus str. MU1402]|uniref:anthranilate phosphoribosyltransferase n=1 Tax=Prochlorococcus marinus TaxID=1219 RepID=UPI001ADC203B|nr:anthranilate phosphoribosyltransferase [Prochlorococcus marinus]MBO8231911.1 anthranilate phosphoribosyltransferase [Prochlorococcus marinus XMU1402]MBW3056657.1 anthranilate phosphoribosyltransferase [Prochlorococcus marinus str. MU1402]
MSSNLSNVEILNILLEGSNLDEKNSRSLMQRWLNDEISDVQTGAFLSALRAKGCTGVELSSMAEELLNVCELPVERPNLNMVDTCGTGGDGANTFNISTAVAFVSASCGVKIAKHGNKSASGKVGSADVLLNLGLNLNCSLEKVVSAVNEIGITFLFAPVWHKSLIKLAPLRKALGIRTVFNQLGPLVNPLRPNAQVLGVASEDLLMPMGSALLKMGMNRAIVVHGCGALDEASLQGENKLVFVENGELRCSKINISDFNYENISNDKLVVSNNNSNEDILKSVLNGTGEESHKEVVALNTALVLWVAGIEDDLHKGFNRALFAINQGDPWNNFLLLKHFLSSDELITN